MVHARWEQILEEYDATPDAIADPEVAAVRVAIFLEDVLGLALSDEDITPERLCNAEQVRALVESRVGR